MSDGKSPRPQVMWEGKYLRAIKQGQWEYVSRVREVRAVVILAEFDGQMILIDQPRAPVGGRCLELPAGLVGDEDPNATIEDTAVKELEEETGFTAERIERLGDFHSSPGMVSESFTLVRAHGVSWCGEGGGTADEDINVHLVPTGDIPAFVADKRAQGFAIDVKLLLFMNFEHALWPFRVHLRTHIGCWSNSDLPGCPLSATDEPNRITQGDFE